MDSEQTAEERNSIWEALLPSIVREAVTPAVIAPAAEDELRIKEQYSQKGETWVKAALWAKATNGEVHEESLPLANAVRRKKFADNCITALSGKLTPEEVDKLRKYVTEFLMWKWQGVQRKEEMQRTMQELTPAEKVTREERKSAVEVLRNPALLYEVGTMLQQLGLVGETKNALLLYLALTSRLTDDIISAAIKAETSSGKSFLVEKVLKLFPSEAYLFFSGMSKQSLYYSEEDFRHRMLVIAEASGMESAEYTIRTLLSEKKLVFKTVERNIATGKNEGRTIEKEGPTGMILTTTLPRLHPENETRFITLSLDESKAQTKRIHQSTARKYSRASRAAIVSLDRWQNAQRLLKSYEVMIPYSDFLSARVPTEPNRVRRDFQKLLSLISASALLHQAQRKCLGDEVEASLEDYFLVKTLFEETFFSSLYGIPKNTRAAMQAIKELSREKTASLPVNAKTGLSEETTVTTKELVERLGWSKGKVLRAVKPLEEYGWVETYGEGKANEYRPGIEPDSAKSTLPTVQEIAEAFPDLAQDFNAVHPLLGTSVKVDLQKLVKLTHQDQSENVSCVPAVPLTA